MKETFLVLTVIFFILFLIYKPKTNPMLETKILESIEPKISLKLEKKFDPVKYFKSGEKLWVSSDFIDRIVSKITEKIPAVFAVSSFELKKDSTDAEIEGALPVKHIFTESEVASVVASLIAKQPNGESGALLNNRKWNLFYTPSFVVRVHFRDSGWYVDTFGRDDVRWDARKRVFSPAIESLDSRPSESFDPLNFVPRAEFEEFKSKVEAVLKLPN